MPLFSIIIPVYNVQNYLSACVKSVVEQPGPRDWECILVDDGSTDQSGAMCDALAAELPGLMVIHRENGGLAAARNTGLKAATGDWLLFLDSDDAMAPGLLAQLRGALAAHPDCDWFIGRHLEWQPDGTLTPHDGLHLVPGPFASSDYAARLKALYTAGHWSVWKYCIRRSFLEQARVRFLPDCVWAEDWPFDLELLLHCDRLYFLDTVFTHYRVGRQGSLLTDAKNLPNAFGALPPHSAAWPGSPPTARRTPRPTPPCRMPLQTFSGRSPHGSGQGRRHPQGLPALYRAAAPALPPRHRGPHPPRLAAVPVDDADLRAGNLPCGRRAAAKGFPQGAAPAGACRSVTAVGGS